jgi:hypothetical protein
MSLPYPTYTASLSEIKLRTTCYFVLHFIRERADKFALFIEFNPQQ